MPEVLNEHFNNRQFRLFCQDLFYNLIHLANPTLTHGGKKKGKLMTHRLLIDDLPPFLSPVITSQFHGFQSIDFYKFS
jgi:hypothetical protein